MANNLKSINNELKAFINEASGISPKCKRKLVSLIEKYFSVDLPNEDFQILNIEILEQGNILMRDVEYKTEKPLTEEELYETFQKFKEDIERILDTNATNFDTMRKKGELSNLLIVVLILSVALIVCIYSVRELINGDLYGFIWIVIMIAYYVVPASGERFRERLIKAKKYLISLFKK